MRLKDEFILRDVCGEKVIIDEGLGAVDFGKLMALNETAAWLWTVARDMGDFTVETLAARLSEEYDVPADTAKADTAAILAQWCRYNAVIT